MADDFCKNLSNAVYLQEKEGDIFYQPCCWVPLSTIPIRQKLDLNIARMQVLGNVKSNVEKNCNQCLSRERTQFNRSHRITANSLIPDSAQYNDPYTLTLQVDTTCNAACVTCGPNYSSLWKKQLDPNAKLDNFESQYQIIFQSVDFKHIKKILFVGGEPFLSSHNTTVLSKVNDPSNVELSYTTNGSVFPSDDVIELWKNFKEVTIVFSIDGTEEQFEYLRWPLSWRKINETINRCTEFSSKGNFKFLINTTINPLNIFYFDRVESWSKNFPIRSVMTSACNGIWGVEATPMKMRMHIEEKYGSDHRLVGLLKSYPEQPEKFSLLLDNAMELDIKRRLDYTTVFSEALRIIAH